MVNKLCLFGGNKEKDDITARDTLLRELREELPDSWYDEIEKTLTPFSRFIVEATQEVVSPKPYSLAFIACVFHASLDRAVKDGDEVNEGSLEILSVESLERETYCWGYDTAFKAYLKEICGIDFDFRTDYEKCNVYRIAPNEDIGVWASSERWN